MKEEENDVDECECHLKSSTFGESESFVSKWRARTKNKREF